MKNVVLIGSGNVATHLGQALYSAGINILQVWSRKEENAQALAQRLEAEPISQWKQLCDTADLYIISVKDNALEEVLKAFPYADKALVHTAGSIGMEFLKPYASKFGVIYPLQTFSKPKEVDFSTIPVLVEASDTPFENSLLDMGRLISQKVSKVSSEQRKYLHVSAVFACNFTNYFYALAEQLLKENDLAFDLIRPLILETAKKALIHSPMLVQTGPAVRKDSKVVNAHLALLNDKPELQKLYADISERIMKA